VISKTTSPQTPQETSAFNDVDRSHHEAEARLGDMSQLPSEKSNFRLTDA
jgi:hypothetical protein